MGFKSVKSWAKNKLEKLGKIDVLSKANKATEVDKAAESLQRVRSFCSFHANQGHPGVWLPS
eukprot:9146984-Pyramimonas_sp.AAC.1